MTNNINQTRKLLKLYTHLVCIICKHNLHTHRQILFQRKTRTPAEFESSNIWYIINACACIRRRAPRNTTTTRIKRKKTTWISISYTHTHTHNRKTCKGLVNVIRNYAWNLYIFAHARARWRVTFVLIITGVGEYIIAFGWGVHCTFIHKRKVTELYSKILSSAGYVKITLHNRNP